jgi:type I restriction enzyme S subunit
MANIGIILYEEKGDIGNKKPEDLGKCKQVYPGDLVINSMNYGIGSYGLSKHRGVCSPVYIVLTPKLNKVEERYVFRILEIKKFQQYAQSFGNGILEHRASISWDILKNIGLPLPPILEQRKILQFLDGETAKIDLLVAEKEKLIKLLKEKRQAVISNAVTKGLDPNVKMKDSGVEWLGDFPEHWSCSILRRSVKEHKQGYYSTENYVDQGVKLLRITDLNGDGTIDYEKCPFVNNCTELNEFLLKEGDFVFARTGGAGTFGKVEEINENVAFASYLIRFRF